MQDEGVQRDSAGDKWPRAKDAQSIGGIRQRVGDDEQGRVEDEAADKPECAGALTADQEPANTKYAQEKGKHDLNNQRSSGVDGKKAFPEG